MKRNLIILMLIAALTPKLAGEAKAHQRTLLGESSRNFHAQKQDDLEGLPRYVAAVMKSLPVTPGLAVAVVRGDKVIFSRDFGYRDVKAKLPVTPRTMFYTASVTKSFTATAAKMLAEEGKLDLDVPIKKYLPNLVLKAPLFVEQISLRDLLTHRSGIDADAVNFRTSYTGQYTTEEIFSLLSEYAKPTSPTFGYDNIGYNITGYAIQNATGESWQKQIERKILEPLGMRATTLYASRVKASSDFALPYLADGGEFTELPYKQDNQMHAAGGVSSSAEDLAKWLIVNMNGGRYDGKQIISATAVEEILSPQINQSREFYKFKRYAYGLGWNIATYNGDKLIHCFGGYPGFRPHVSFMPAHDLGVVVLANEGRDGAFVPDLIASDIYDYLLHGKDLQVDSNPKVEEQAARLQRSKEQRIKTAVDRELKREKGTKPTLELKAYGGVYENPEYGRIEVTAGSGSLVVKFGNLSAVARHRQRDEFDVTLIPGNTEHWVFTVSGKDGVTKLSGSVNDAISFVKVK